MKDYITIHINEKLLINLLMVVALIAVGEIFWVLGNDIYDNIYNTGYNNGLGEGTASCTDDLSGYEFIDISGDYTEYIGYYDKVICTQGCSFVNLSGIDGGWISNNAEIDCGCYVKNDALVSGEEP